MKAPRVRQDQPLTATQALALMLIGLKLAQEIDWSWWWVLAPIWLPWTLAGSWVVFWWLWTELSCRSLQKAVS